MIGFIAGLAIGAAAGVAAVDYLPRLRSLFPQLDALLRKVPPALPVPATLAARLEAAIAEIEQQMRDGFDREKNAARLAILREVRGDQ